MKRGKIAVCAGIDVRRFDAMLQRDTIDNPQLPPQFVSLDQSNPTANYSLRHALSLRVMLDIAESVGPTSDAIPATKDRQTPKAGRDLSGALYALQALNDLPMDPLIYPREFGDMGIGYALVYVEVTGGFDYQHFIKVSGLFTDLQDIALAKIEAGSKGCANEKSELVRLTTVNVSRAADYVFERASRQHLSEAELRQDDDALLEKLRKRNAWPDWVPEAQRDWSLIRMVDPE